MFVAPKHDWLQFSLRTLFVVTTLLAGVAGYGIREAVRCYQDKFDRQAIDEALKDAWLRNDQGIQDF